VPGLSPTGQRLHLPHPAQGVSAGDGVVRVSGETKGGGGKAVTLVRSVSLDATALAALGKWLRISCGSGGTFKDGVVQPRLDHVERVIGQMKLELLKL